MVDSLNNAHGADSGTNNGAPFHPGEGETEIGSSEVRIRSRVEVPVRLDTDAPPVISHMVSFSGLSDGREHLAVTCGTIGEAPIVRLHSECLTGDVFGSHRCDCGPQLDEAMQVIGALGGIVLYLRHEGRGIGLYNKLDAYHLQSTLSLDTFAANREMSFPDDLRDYRVAGEMLRALGVRKIRLLSNNPDKFAQLKALGITIEETIPTGVFVNERNLNYLQTKAEKAGHRISISEELV
jgi:GTP cyclohydrolase II